MKVSLGLPSVGYSTLGTLGQVLKQVRILVNVGKIDARNMNPDKTRLMKMQARNDKNRAYF